MNKERFLVFQNSIDDDLLEEAASYHKVKVNWLRYAALAACFCAVIAGVLAWHPWRLATYSATAAVPAMGAEKAADTAVMYDTFAAPEAPMPMPEATDSDYDVAESYELEEAGAVPNSNDSVMSFGSSAAIPNPVRECTLDDIAAMGFDITLPEGSELIFSATIDMLAEVKFMYGGCEYLLRAMKTAQSEDISGVYDTVRKALNWSSNGTAYEIREGSEGIVLSWYSSEESAQWCLWSRDCGAEVLMKTAGEIRGEEIQVPAD